VAKRLNVVFDDEDLYQAVKVEAARRGVAAKQIVAEAVERWLLEQEEREDVEASMEALTEYRSLGGTPAEQTHAGIRAIIDERERIGPS
jgi:hypothetical protein